MQGYEPKDSNSAFGVRCYRTIYVDLYFPSLFQHHSICCVLMNFLYHILQ